jgi:biopolymer transport protein ExbB
MQIIRELGPVHLGFLIPMLFLSMFAFGLVLWRLALNYSASTNLNSFLPQLQDRLAKEGVEGGLRYCKAQHGLIPRKLCVAGLDTSKQGLAAMRRAMVNAAELEILPQLNFLLPLILAIAKIATMLGLLGTVISMIGTFSALSDAKTSSELGGQGKDIGLALFATALGLLTAIPLVFSHVLFKAWNHNFELKMKSCAQKLLLIVQAQKPGAATAAAAPVPTPAAASAVRR